MLLRSFFRVKPIVKSACMLFMCVAMNRLQELTKTCHCNRKTYIGLNCEKKTSKSFVCVNFGRQGASNWTPGDARGPTIGSQFIVISCRDGVTWRKWTVPAPHRSKNLSSLTGLGRSSFRLWTVIWHRATNDKVRGNILFIICRSIDLQFSRIHLNYSY